MLDSAHAGVLKNEKNELSYDKNKELRYKAQRIVILDDENWRILEFSTNNFDLSAKDLAWINFTIEKNIKSKQ